MPVLEALLDDRALVTNVVVARNAEGDSIVRIVEQARVRGVPLQRADPQRVTRISRNGRHDQGVVARVNSPGLRDLGLWLDDHRRGPVCLILLDGLTNPSNVGMIIRTAVAAGLDGVILPSVGSPEVGPLVVKASAGVALFAPVLRAETGRHAAEALARAGVKLIGLRSTAPLSIWETEIGARSAFVLGNETLGISVGVAELITNWSAIPLGGGVESLNVASAGTVVAFEVARRARTRQP